MTWDYVMMLPMIEMAGERHLCIQDQIMYVYNNANSISDHKISRQLQAHLAQVVRAKKRYQRLPEKQQHFTQNLDHEKADIIIFAEECNPILLDKCVASIQKNITGLGKIYVLYLSRIITTQDYSEFKGKYPEVSFLPIDENRANFKDLINQVFMNMVDIRYVVLALPNCTVEQPINLVTCIKALEETHAFGFSLKLSQEDSYIPIPPRMVLLEIQDDICAWYYATANDAWACANNVDMTLYRSNNPSLLHILQNYWIYSWVHLVGWWSHEGNLDKVGLCFKYPKMIQIS